MSDCEAIIRNFKERYIVADSDYQAKKDFIAKSVDAILALEKKNVPLETIDLIASRSFPTMITPLAYPRIIVDFARFSEGKEGRGFEHRLCKGEAVDELITLYGAPNRGLSQIGFSDLLSKSRKGFDVGVSKYPGIFKLLPAKFELDNDSDDGFEEMVIKSKPQKRVMGS